MAITTIPTLNQHMFSGEFQTLVLNGVTQPVTFAVYGPGSPDPVLSARYFPDGRNSVTIYDLDVLLDTLPDDISAPVRMTVDGNTLGPDMITIFKCAASMGESAETFVDDFFLTTSMGERDTVMGRLETVTVFTRAEERVDALCTYRQDDGTVMSRSTHITSVNGCAMVDVSPARFDSPGEQLVGYVVVCGKRKARYRVLGYAPGPDPSILFRNCFHAWEVIHLTGKKEMSGAYTRSSALIEGRSRTYHIDEVISYKAMTGPLRPGELPVALDLARSKEVFMVNADGSDPTEITITDCDTKYTNEDNELPDLSFTFRLAERRNARVAVVRPPRVFDMHFDSTYE